MPANLGPDYLAAEQEYRRAESATERIAALERMYAALPKHKGTEKMQAELKRRLSQARKDAQKKGVARGVPFYLVPREGAGQVVLLGPANAGKSALLRALTHARPEVAEYPFTTRLPTPGMLNFENVQIQLVDLPALAEEFTEPWMAQVVRYATSSALVVDVNDGGVLDGIEYIERRLEEWHTPLGRLLVGNKTDLPGGAESLAVLAELCGAHYRVVGVSAATGAGLAEFARAVFEQLDLVRVYTKAPGKRAELAAPYVLKRGATVLDAALHVHKDFAEHLKFARLYRIGAEHDGLMVDRRHAVEDEDILEFHI